MSSFEQARAVAMQGEVTSQPARFASHILKITQNLRRQRGVAVPRTAVAAATSVAQAADARVRRLELRVAAHLPVGQVELALTDNRHTMVSVKRERGPRFRARIHRMFLDAPPVVTRALARYIASNDRVASRVIGEFIDSNHETIRRRAARAPQEVVLETRGEVHDLREIYDFINRKYFAGKIAARIGWGAKSAARRRRRTSIKLGSYSVEAKLIRIHQALDQQFVPRYFIEWIVYHEMLHQVHAIPMVRGRRQFHTPAFIAAERQYECFELAREFERKHVDKFLSY